MRLPLLGLFGLALVSAPLGAQDPAPLASFDTAWAAMSRAYFDTALVNGRWRVAHDSLRRALGPAPTLDAVHDALRALIRVPGQSHFALIPKEALPQADDAEDRDAPPGASGIVPRLVADTLVVWRVEAGSGAAAAGVRPGDIIERIDATATDSLRRRIARVFPTSPREANALFVQVVMRELSGTAGDSMTLALRDLAGQPRRVRLALRAPSGRVSEYGNLPAMRIDASLDTTVVRARGRDFAVPVIAFSAWFPVIIPDLDRFAFASRGAPGVIIDLRGNLGGVIGIIGGFAGHFSDSAWSLGAMRGRTGVLRLTANPRLVTRSGERVGTIGAPVAILVDEMSASSSEFFAAGMQGLGRARVFGEVTAGQSLPAAMLRLPSGDVLMFPIADHVDAKGRRIEGRGVEPDTRTPLTRREIAAGRDAALEAARAWLAEAFARP
jgi:carboxyl-terminal processing protease